MAYLNIRKAAEYLGVSHHTLYKLVERGEVPAAKVGGSWRFSEATIDDYIAGKTNRPRSPEVMIVEPDAPVRKELVAMFISRGARPQPALDGEEAALLLSARPGPEMVIYSAPDGEAELTGFVRQARALCPESKVVVVVPPERMVEVSRLLAGQVAYVLPAPLERPEVVNLLAQL